jgi:IMP cyclohydrolase
MDLSEHAAMNLQALSRNPYPGRGIVLGCTPSGDPIQIYWIMGRSKSSRNRILEPISDKQGWLKTRIADPSEFTGDPSLLIYTAMAEAPGVYIVSNGAQTDAVVQSGMSVLENGSWQYEPDRPNFTPRVTGITRRAPDGTLQMDLVILKKSPLSEACDHLSYSYSDVAAGYGYFISTYTGDGDPLPAFCGKPLLLPIESNEPAKIAETYWSTLDLDNRVALAVKIIPYGGPSETTFINHHPFS